MVHHRFPHRPKCLSIGKQWSADNNRMPIFWNTQPHIESTIPWFFCFAMIFPWLYNVSPYVPITWRRISSSLSIYLSIYLSTVSIYCIYLLYLSIYLSIYLSFDLSTYLSINPSIDLSTYLLTYLPLCRSISQHILKYTSRTWVILYPL